MKRPPTVSPDTVMGVAQAAAIKGVHRSAVYQAICAGRLKAWRSGVTYLIQRADLDAWVIIGHRPKKKRKQ